MKETNRYICTVAYIVFFVPLLVDHKNKEYVFHANQGLNLFGFTSLIAVLSYVEPFLGEVLILPLGMIVVFVFGVIGVVNALNGNLEELPFIGFVRLIK